MLIDFGCTYAIVGHSERRAIYRESDDQVANKFQRACAEGLRPILCVGETLEERESDQTQNVIARQLGAVLDTLGAGGLDDAVVAYEPVWAIGTGKTATPEMANDVHEFIRERLHQHSSEAASRTRILYGGSVKSSNAQALFAMPDIDGGLIGGGLVAGGRVSCHLQRCHGLVMQQFILIIHVLVSIGVVALVLLQHGRGADAGAAFGGGSSGSIFGSRGPTTFLTRLTTIFVTVFFLTSLSLAWLSKQSVDTRSVVERVQPVVAEEDVIVEETTTDTSSGDLPDLPAAPENESENTQSE